MHEILLIIFLVVALALVGVILLQQGKGAGMGASFGAGASGTVFGAPGSGNVLTKVTTVLAIIFFGVALTLGYIANGTGGEVEKDIFDKAEESQKTLVTPAPKTDIPVETKSAPESDIPAVKATETKTDDTTPVTDSTEATPEKEDDDNK
ncbi:preprotein translocase subunit SecG [Pleionea litopenaei]|uniref:Protein-export membrane protein SecG n=1 Tax=Pleionea litopenaei TaxID=3070815 RepID=A0AA51RS10_9GAMM|nr:preprotein translocase subunit SecG [Pleionea sp. HL-JVS1]WMS86507.1 preprotein translocase subunit SecG [Pleionea sp. HL-JVS1]